MRTRVCDVTLVQSGLRYMLPEPCGGYAHALSAVINFRTRPLPLTPCPVHIHLYSCFIQPADADAHKAHLAAGAPADQQLAGAKYFRGLTTAAAPVSALALAQGGVLSPLVALIGGSSTTDEVKSEALWAVGNAAAGGFESAQAVSDAGAPAALASVLAHASGSILELVSERNDTFIISYGYLV